MEALLEPPSMRLDESLEGLLADESSEPFPEHHGRSEGITSVGSSRGEGIEVREVEEADLPRFITCVFDGPVIDDF